MPQYSYSRLETFLTCPRKYAYQYIEKPPVQKKLTIEAHLGTVCHETIQRIYKDLTLSKRLGLEETLAFYGDQWDKTKTDDLCIVQERYGETEYKETGRRYIETFYRRYAPFEDGRTIGIEQKVLFNLGRDKYLVGYMDRLVDHGDGRYEIVDYKTSRTLPSMQDLENNWQLPLYHMGLLDMLPDMKECACSWIFLAFDKKVTLKKSAEDLKRLRAEVSAVIERVEAAKEFNPMPSALCSWCDYESLCPARRQFVASRLLPAQEMSREDGVRLAETYAALKKRAEDSLIEAEWAGRQIMDYVKAHGLSVLWGTQHKIKIWRGRGVRLPKKDEEPERFLAVIDIIKRHGLWDQFSNLQAFPLSKALQEGRVPEAARKELEPYLQTEEIERLYLSKLS